MTTWYLGVLKLELDFIILHTFFYQYLLPWQENKVKNNLKKEYLKIQSLTHDILDLPTNKFCPHVGTTCFC